MRVAFQGERGANSEEAVVHLFGDVDLVPCARLSDAFGAVANGRADCGVVPVENSTAGSINETYDLLLAHDLVIAGELDHRVVHSLMALPGQTLAAVTRVYSHPQALAQCDAFLRQHGLEAVLTQEHIALGERLRMRVDARHGSQRLSGERHQ